MNKVYKFTLAAALALFMALIFNACSSDDGGDPPDGGVSSSSDGTVADNNIYTVKAGYAAAHGFWNGNSAGLEIWNGNGTVIGGFHCNDDGGHKFNAGEIANGKISIDLPSEAEIPVSCFANLSGIEGLSVSPQDVKIAETNPQFYIAGNDGNCYVLQYAVFSANEEVRVRYWHLSKAATISGMSGTTTINVNSPQGWSTIYAVKNTSVILTLDRSVLEVEPVWHIVGGGDEETCEYYGILQD